MRSTPLQTADRSVDSLLRSVSKIQIVIDSNRTYVKVGSLVREDVAALKAELETLQDKVHTAYDNLAVILNHLDKEMPVDFTAVAIPQEQVDEFLAANEEAAANTAAASSNDWVMPSSLANIPSMAV